MRDNDDVFMAASLARLILTRSFQDREYLAGVRRYNSEPDFRALFNSLCEGLGLAVPLPYGADFLSLAPAGKSSPFALRSAFFANVASDEKPKMLALFYAAIICFWPDHNLFGDHEESNWIDENDITGMIFSAASDINASARGFALDAPAVWREIYNMRDTIEAKRASSGTLAGLAKKCLNNMEAIGFARGVRHSEGTRYKATPQLCAHLASPAWKEFEALLAGGNASDDSEGI